MAEPNDRNAATRADPARETRTPELDGQSGPEPRSFDAEGAGDPILGEGTPANVDVHKLGQSDRPEEGWGEAGGEAVFSSNHSRRGEMIREQGEKTRRATKDIISRRS